MSNQNPGPFGPPSPEARAEVRRIYADFIARKLGAGDVHVYLLRPDGTSLGGMDPGQFADAEQMRRALTDAVRQLGTAPGAPVVKPRPQSVPPQSSPDDLVLHLVARSQSVGGSWHEVPSENWAVLTRAEWMQLLPRDPPRPGVSWELGTDLTRKLLGRFYPQTEETTNRDRNRIDLARLQCTITTVSGEMVRARMDGAVRMKHAFYPGKDHEDYVEAKVAGFVDFATGTPRIERLRLVSEKAAYMGTPFDAALRSVSRETLEALGQ